MCQNHIDNVKPIVIATDATRRRFGFKIWSTHGNSMNIEIWRNMPESWSESLIWNLCWTSEIIILWRPSNLNHVSMMYQCWGKDTKDCTARWKAKANEPGRNQRPKFYPKYFQPILKPKSIILSQNVGVWLSTWGFIFHTGTKGDPVIIHWIQHRTIANEKPTANQWTWTDYSSDSCFNVGSFAKHATAGLESYKTSSSRACGSATIHCSCRAPRAGLPFNEQYRFHFMASESSAPMVQEMEIKTSKTLYGPW